MHYYIFVKNIIKRQILTIACLNVLLYFLQTYLNMNIWLHSCRVSYFKTAKANNPIDRTSIIIEI